MEENNRPMDNMEGQTSGKTNPKAWAWWLVVIAVIALLIFMFTRGNRNEVALEGENTDTDSSVMEEDVPAESAQDLSGTSGVEATTLTYAEALAQYEGRRIQLDLTCQARPNAVTYKDHTGIMFDNRSPETRTVKAGETFTIAPYSFKIFTLPDISEYPETILVDCDESQNVATILVQE